MTTCYFCKTTGQEGGVMLESTGINHPDAGLSPYKWTSILICPPCKKEAIAFWKHHFDLGLLE